uniref:Uncharacterized protein n=1 Tax=Ralstonia syzygii R24 TaxID=907261 RepID=G3A9T3_9RALS|nr:hypothetical protein RALSY_mp10590 [Ralstonia syzygii R24]
MASEGFATYSASGFHLNCRKQPQL